MPAQRIHAFAEKVALVTDGANDVGRAVALQLALEGCYVIVGFSETSEGNSRALAELQSIGTLANAVQTDISTLEGIETLFRTVEETYGRLDLLINTANFTPQNSFSETSPEEFAETVRRNFKATFFACQNALRLMSSRPSPSIVNVFSAPETVENALFASINYALVGLTKSLANELAPKIRVNGVAVNFTPEKEPENADEFAFLTKKDGVSADDVARAVTYLLSPEAKAIRGQIITVGEKRAKL